MTSDHLLLLTLSLSLSLSEVAKPFLDSKAQLKRATEPFLPPSSLSLSFPYTFTHIYLPLLLDKAQEKEQGVFLSR